MQIRDHLLEEIKKMKPGNNRLAPEEDIAKKMGVSRATVRQAMEALIREGYISRRQGKGNFGHPGVTGLAMRFDRNSDFRNLVRESGGDFSLKQANMQLAHPSARMLKRMPHAEKEQTLTFDWIYQDNQRAAIHCKIEVLRYLVREIPKKELSEERLSDFLSRYCMVEISHTATWLSSSIDPDIARIFRIERGRSMVVWEEIFYDLYDREICFNTIHFHPDRIDLSMLIHI
jgi:GntR family transcriptional regulator